MVLPVSDVNGTFVPAPFPVMTDAEEAEAEVLVSGCTVVDTKEVCGVGVDLSASESLPVIVRETSRCCKEKVP